MIAWNDEDIVWFRISYYDYKMDLQQQELRAFVLLTAENISSKGLSLNIFVLMNLTMPISLLMYSDRLQIRFLLNTRNV